MAFGNWFSNRTWPFSSPKDSPDTPGKRKRSPTPRRPPNDEVVPDSEEEADELTLYGAPSPRNVRRKTESIEPCSSEDERRAPQVPVERRATTSLHFQPSRFKAPEPAREEPEDEIEHLEKTVREKTEDIRSLQRELAEMRRKQANLAERNVRLEKIEEKYKKAKDDAQSAQRQIQDLERRCQDTQRSLKQKEKLLRTRTEELTAVQAFTTTAGKYSNAEVARMVELLNDDIFQTAAVLADALLQDKLPATEQEFMVPQAVHDARQQALQRYGEKVMGKLLDDIAQDDTILFEGLVQNDMARWCHTVINSITAIDHPGADEMLAAVWERIATSYDLPIAKNWRAMTSSQLKIDNVDTSSLAHRIFCLMKCCGWKPEDTSTDRPPDPALERLSEIQAKALKIQEVLNEGILSAEVESFYVQTDEPYNPTWMQDAYEIGKPAAPGHPQDTVITTTALGLRSVKRKPASSESSDSEKVYDVLLKPKVLLLSALVTLPQQQAEDYPP